MKSWSDVFIQKPIWSISLSLLIVFVGIMAFFKLPLRLFPSLEIPVITINVNYAGATAETMKDFVTDNIQNALSGINGLDYITSSSTDGNSEINLHFKAGTNSDLALSNVMEKVSSVRGILPNKIDDPVITKSNADDNPMLLFAFTSESRSRASIADYLLRNIKPEFESIDGVAQAKILGSRYAMRIWLNPKLMAAYHLSSDDIISALQHKNVQSDPGIIEGQATNFNVSLESDLTTPEQFNNMIIKNQKDQLIRLKDIGRATLGSESNKINAFYKSKPAVMIFLHANQEANPLHLIDKVDQLLPSIKKSLPENIEMHEVVNASIYIKKSIDEVIFSLILSIIIVSIIIFLFLGSLRGMIIPLITIPISLLGMCFLLRIFGFSLNLLTLLAMVIAIGLVVDDAIIVMENIFRYIERGANSYKAALQGTKEIAFAIIGMTITLAVIYTPIALSNGLTEKLFSEFACSIAGSVIISGIIALTLSALMSSRLLNPHLLNKKLISFITNIFYKLIHSFDKSLTFVMRKKPWIIFIWLLSLIFGFYFYSTIPKELSPKEDVGFLEVLATTPDSTNTNFLMKNTFKFNDIYKRFNEFKSYMYINGIPNEHQALSFVRLKPWGDRKKSSMTLAPALQSKLDQIAGLDAVVILPSVLPGTSGFPIQFVLKSIGSYKQLYQETQRIKKIARKSGLFLFIDSDLKYDQPQLKVSIDRNAAGLLNVSINSISNTLSSLLSDNRVQYFNMSGQSYEVITKSLPHLQLDHDILNQFEVKSENGDMIPLSALITIKNNIVPASLNQFQKFNSVTLTGVMAPGHSLSEGLIYLANQAMKILPPDIHFDYAGNSRQFLQEGHRMIWIYFAVFFSIFLVLSILFESFRDPLIILFGSIPFAFFAALIPLKLGFGTINIYTQIGLLTLTGLISKHGILITHFANKFKRDGFSKIDAIKMATKIRLRPILMTTCCIVFGSLPLIFSEGAGQVSRFNIGIVIIVGMLIGTVFTLYILPVFYLYLSSNFVKNNISE